MTFCCEQMGNGLLTTRSLAGYNYIFMSHAKSLPEKGQIFLYSREEVLYARLKEKDPFIVRCNLNTSKKKRNEINKIISLIKKTESIKLLSEQDKRDLGIYTSLSNYLNRGDNSIQYDEQWRDFFIHYQNTTLEKKDDEWLSAISYCPFCGTKLPESLADKWFDVLKDEYAIIDPSDTEFDKVPAEFRTDEWWRKRGL